MRLRGEEAALGRAPLQKEKRDPSTAVGMTEEMKRRRARLKSCAYTGRRTPTREEGHDVSWPYGRQRRREAKSTSPPLPAYGGQAQPARMGRPETARGRAGQKIEGATAVRD